MSFYVIQVETGSEARILSLARGVVDPEGAALHWPRRRLTERRRGRPREVLSPLFPGYLFIEVDTIDIDFYWKIREIPGVYKFLESNTNILPLGGADRELLVHFLSFGEIVEKSIVTFDENSRIRVVSGPMEGLDGLIVKVDKRKGRAKVRLDLYRESFLVDLGFEILKAEASSSRTDGHTHVEHEGKT